MAKIAHLTTSLENKEEALQLLHQQLAEGRRNVPVPRGLDRSGESERERERDNEQREWLAVHETEMVRLKVRTYSSRYSQSLPLFPFPDYPYIYSISPTTSMLSHYAHLLSLFLYIFSHMTSLPLHFIPLKHTFTLSLSLTLSVSLSLSH